MQTKISKRPTLLYGLKKHVKLSNTLLSVYTNKHEVHLFDNLKGKGKAIPLQALTGPEGSRRLRLPDFKTIGT
jgi:hypothetical protein